MNSLDSSPVFSSKFKRIFWPIKRSELGKFIPMSALMFFILFNQNVLRILKDSILISEVSAEVTSFAKVYCVTPLSTIFVIFYAKAVNHLPFDRIFYYLSIIFGVFYVLFAFIIYPNISFFHIDYLKIESLMLQYPHLKWYISLVGNWSYVLFYTLSELWPNIFYVLLFWQFANELTSTNEAKRFYTLFSLLGNSSLIIVGLMIMSLSSQETFSKKNLMISDSKLFLTQISISMVILSSVFSCLIIRYITKRVMSNSNFYLKEPGLTKTKMGIVESFKYIAGSKYLWLMLICSAAFGLSMNLVEAVWKSKIKELYPGVTEYAAFSGMYILWTGVVIMIMTIIGNNIMRAHNWLAAAIIAPVTILITGTLFFFLVVFDEEIVDLIDGAILVSPLMLAVFVGAIQNILSKGAKYSIWDSSIQMLYIPLDQELKTKGKAAVDVISQKVGKSASGLIQSIIFTIVPAATYSSISFGLMIIFIAVCVFWMYAVRKIYGYYLDLL